MRSLFRPFAFRAVLALAALAVLAPSALALDLGEEAPEIDVTEWVSGTAVDFEADKSKFVHVVAFFVTFEERSQNAFKQLGEVHEKYKDKGLRCFVVCDQTADDMREWLKENPQPFPVAADPRKNTVAPYMKGERGPPFVFIVGKEGNVYWKGHPSVGFEDVLEKVMTGKYDAEHETAVAEARKHLYQVWQKGQPEPLEKAADALLALEPADSEVLGLKLSLVQRPENRGDEPDPTRFHDFCTEHLPKVQDNAEALNQFAWTLATHGSFKFRKPKLALETAKKAVKVCKGEKGGIVDTLARVYFEIGMLQRAVETQKKAVSVAEDDKEKKDLKETADYYEKCLKVMQSERK